VHQSGNVESTSIISNKSKVASKLTSFFGGRSDKKQLQERHILQDEGTVTVHCH
jgi:hypothetical protein